MANKVPLIVPLLLAFSGTALACAYHGTAVDADTGEPIQGAAVVVVWYTRPYIAMPAGDAPETLHAIKETTTDAIGRFAVSTWRGIDWNPFTHVLAPTIVIYKPGYEPLSPSFTVRRGFRSSRDLQRALRGGTTIRLPKHTPECRLDQGFVG